jgi:hypothetical protein
VGKEQGTHILSCSLCSLGIVSIYVNVVHACVVLDEYKTWPSNGKTLIEMMREDSNGVE